MLQQILNDMYIEPELLEELSEEQKQILFYKMREEQIRRWKVREEKLEDDEKKKPVTEGKKKVDFLKARDGCEWVWVMGEHPNDKSIEQILEEEAKAMAQKLADAEADAMRLKEEAALLRKIEEERQQVNKEKAEREAEMKRKQEEAELYKSVKEARLALQKMELEKKKEEEENKRRLSEIEEEEKLARRRSREVANNIRDKRSSEIFTNLQKRRQDLEKQALEGQKEVDTSWQEQDKRSSEIFTNLQKRRQDLEKQALEGQKEVDTSWQEQDKRSSEIFTNLQKRRQDLEKQALEGQKEVDTSWQEQDKRSSEIFTNLQKRRQDLEKQALEGQKEVDTSWQEQEKKSKEADIKMRDSARQARTEYRESLRRSMTLMQAVDAFAGTPLAEGSKAPVPPKRYKKVASLQAGAKKMPRPAKPENRQMIVDWFVREEKDRVRVQDASTNSVVPWFHGMITRADSEKLLLDKKKGAFLVRVSERVWGYTLSYRSSNRCKHFLVDASDSGYQFIGADQTVHESLAQLVAFHKDNPITISGQEKLLYACGQTSSVPDFSEFFRKV